MIPSQLSSTYTTLAHEMQAFKERVDPILKAYAEEQEGQYSSRVKTVDSIFDKVVLGNYQRLADIEDIFAATIVLPSAPIGNAIRALTESLSCHFSVHEIRSNRTRRPTEFIYDDLHYILSLKDSPLLLNKRLLAFSFELQVKSYLQHGWAKATHNTVYKASIESWRASRVAAQTRAAVEMVEAALGSGESLLPDEADQRFKTIDDRVAVVGHLLEWWRGEVPDNRRRLGVFAVNCLKMANLPLEGFEALLHSERGETLQHVRSLSVQQAFLVLLLENSFDSMVRNVRREEHQYLLITSEMEAVSETCMNVPADIRFIFTPEGA